MVNECSIYAPNITLAVMCNASFPQRNVIQVTILLKVNVALQPGILIYTHRL